jgi:hypothetical protein
VRVILFLKEAQLPVAKPGKGVSEESHAVNSVNPRRDFVAPLKGRQRNFEGSCNNSFERNIPVKPTF